MKKIIKEIGFGFICIIFTLLVFTNNIVINASDYVTYETINELFVTERYKPKIDDDFSGSKIIITLAKEYSGVNKKLNFNDFQTEMLIYVESENYDQSLYNQNICFKGIYDLMYFKKGISSLEVDNFRQIVLMELHKNSKEEVLIAIEELEKLEFVLAAEPYYNYIAFDNDSLYCNDTDYNLQWGLRYSHGIQIEDAWSLVGNGTLNNRICVGIFEDGIQSNHPDLRVVSGNTSGYSNHGTHVGGIIGAISNNEMGIAGVAQVNIALLNRSTFVESLTWAIDNDIRIVNASFYYGTLFGYSPANVNHVAAIQNYGLFGGIFIVASGNDGVDNDIDTHGKVQFPAGYANPLNFPQLTNIISVGASRSTGYKWIDSNYGKNSVHLFAPGEGIYSTLQGSTYGEMSGTSMAAPHVAGVAALLLSINPNLTVVQLKEAILESVTIPIIDDNNPLEDLCITDGRLNAYNAVKYVLQNFIDERMIDCYSKPEISTVFCNLQNYVFYKINISCNTSYKFVSNASYPINMTFYDEDLEVMSSITPTMSNNNCTGTIITTLTPGTYYLRVNYVSDSDTGNITTSFRPTTLSDGVELYIDANNNINTHIHKTIDNNYHTEGYYENISGAGFYKITLIEGSNVYYPAGTIKIYEDSARQYLIDKYDVTGMNIPAVSNEGENILYVFFPDICTYYFDITLPYSSYSSLVLRIERSDINNLDYSNTLLYSSFNPLFENVSSRTYFEEVTISHRSKFRIEISSNDTLYNLIPFYVFKKEGTTGYNPYDRYYNIQVSNSSFYLNTNQTSKVYIIILEAGTYYVGYNGNVLNKRLNCAIGRIVDYDASSLDSLVTDYATTEGFVLGSEVTFNGGLLQGTTITEGFTRCLYLMFEPGVEIPNSRLDYDWYSSNTNVATVSSYGTVLGLPVSNNTNVTIYAILREDPSVVYSINLTILNDTSVIPIEIESYMSYSYSAQNGTYQLALDSSNCPFPRISYYEYDIEVSTLYPDLVVSMNLWGYITSNGTGEATITGSYNLNSRVTLTVYLTITS